MATKYGLVGWNLMHETLFKWQYSDSENVLGVILTELILPL